MWEGTQVPAYTAAAQTYLTTAEDGWRIALRMAGDDMDFTATAQELGETTARIHRDLARAGFFVDKILKGTNPADLPIERVSKFQFILNRKAANALGFELPHSILLRADEVIE